MTVSDSIKTFQFRIDSDGVGMRLDQFLTDLEDPPLSRSQIKRRIDRGEVLVNGDQVKAGYSLKHGDELEWSYHPPAPLSARPQAIPLDVLFEDEHLAIVNKPAGMVVHPAPGHPDGTLVNAILYHFDQLSGSAETLRPGIVHRIDKDTSGAIAVTKTAEAHRHLAALFSTHDIERTYHALAYGPRLADRGTFDTLHGRHPRDRIKFTGRVTSGRRAVTHYEVLERFDHGVVLVQCRLETGRTHQIRVHLSEAGAPLLGDQVYAGKKVADTKLIGRQALHARTLGFEHIDGTTVSVEAPYPDDFEQALGALRAGKHW